MNAAGVLRLCEAYTRLYFSDYTHGRIGTKEQLLRRLKKDPIIKLYDWDTILYIVERLEKERST